ncbi:MAG: hypothetical protein ACYTGZ_02145 [Planctomycetota bacterium]|jgi:hypothetical protein
MLRNLLLSIVPALLFCACGSGGGGGDGGNNGGGNNPVPGLLQLSECSADGFAAADGLLNALAAVVDEINGTPRDEVTAAPPAFIVDADLDGNGTLEATLQTTPGGIDGDDISDGFDVGERMAWPWNTTAGPITTNGALEVTRESANSLRIMGSGFIELVDGCQINVQQIDLTFANVAIPPPPTGSLSLVADDGVNTLTADVNIPVTSTIATVTGDIDGVAVSFKVDLSDFSIVP